MTDEIPWDAEARLVEHGADGAETPIGTGTLRDMVKAGAQMPADRHASITLLDAATAAAHGPVDEAMLRRYAGLILSGDDHHGG